MNRTALAMIATLALLLPTASAQDITFTFIPPGETRVPEEIDEAREPYRHLVVLGMESPWAYLNETWEGIQRTLENPGGGIHCGQTPLFEGKTGVAYDPQSRHLTVFVGPDAPSYVVETWQDLSSILGVPFPTVAPPLPVDFEGGERDAEPGAGVDAGVCNSLKQDPPEEA